MLALVLSSVRLWDSRWSLTNVEPERTSTRSRSRGSLQAAVAAVSVAGYLLFQWLEDILPNAVLAIFIDDIGIPKPAPDYPVLTMIGALTGTLLVGGEGNDTLVGGDGDESFVYWDEWVDAV